VSASGEFELGAMRARFVAVSEEIAKDLLLLTSRIDEEPAAERASQLAAAKEIDAAQERLRIEVNQLAGPLQRRVAKMQSVLQVQQVVQLQLVGIVKRHSPSTSLQAKLEERFAEIAQQQLPARVPRYPSEEVRPAHEPVTIRRGQEHAPNVRSTADLSLNQNSKTAEMLPASMPLAAIVKAVVSLPLLFCLMLVAALGLVVSYTSLPRDSHQQQMAAEPVLREPHAGGIPPMPSPRGARIREQPAATRAEDPLPALQVPAPLSRRPPAPNDSSNGRQPGVPATPAPQSSLTPASNPPPTALSNGAERFVPVVFTHKEKGPALRAFAELQRKYPEVLTHRQSQLQSMDTGKNGIWYRLVVLPAGSRQEASEFCGRLEAAGYERCWVKAY
jgi:SPOR domain